MVDDTKPAFVEAEAAASISATFANRAYVAGIAGSLIRVAFAEASAGIISYRGAYVLSAADAVAIAELIVRIAKEQQEKSTAVKD